MNTKNLIYLLFAIIFLMIIQIASSLHKKNKNTGNKTNSTNEIIKQFEQKFHSDSIQLAKKNQLIIDLLSQKIIDSISNAYENKLKLALLKNKKYVSLLKKHNINPLKNPIKKFKYSSNVTSYKSLLSKNNNDTGYTSLNKNNTSNVTTYTQLPGYKETNPNLAPPSSNVTTYTQLPNYKNSLPTSKKKTTTFNRVSKQSKLLHKKQKNIPNSNQTGFEKHSMHNSYELKNAVNINNIEFVPVYPGCESKSTKKERMNCFSTKISTYLFTNFKTDNITTQNLSKGVNNVRVIFIIDENGNSKPTKIYGKWSADIKAEITRAIESIPKMQAGRSNGKSKPVKYSVLIPFVIN